jgi:8-oxo-dGTP diphosphatase
LSGRPIGGFTIEFKQENRAGLHARFEPAAWSDGLAAEALRRCLRMLFDNFGIGLVEPEIAGKTSDVEALFASAGFPAVRAGTAMLSRADWLTWRAGRKNLFVAAAALIDADGRVLLAQRPAGKAMAGQWEFPGGKLAEGETPEQALIRELGEELGIDVTLSCLAPLAFASHDYDHFHLVMPLYAIRQWSGLPSGREGQNLSWVAKNRLGDYPMPPADVPLIAQLRDWL